MPELREVFRDGPEHVRRTARRALSRARLHGERSALERLRLELGRRAWEANAPSCATAPSGQALAELELELGALSQRADKEKRRIESRLAEAERQVETEEKRLAELESRLAGALRQLDRRRGLATKLGKQLDALRRRRERLKHDLAFYRGRRRRQGADDESSAGRGGDTEPLEARLEEAAKEIRSLQSRLRYNVKALPKLEEAVAQRKAERDGSAKRVGEARARFKGLAQDQLASRERARRDFKPLRGRRRELLAALGEELLSRRSDEPELQPLFSAADLAISTIENLENEIEAETTLLGLLDPSAVAIFIAVAVGSGLAVLALFALLVTLLIVL